MNPNDRQKEEGRAAMVSALKGRRKNTRKGCYCNEELY
jgi:hypothetical protein